MVKGMLNKGKNIERKPNPIIEKQVDRNSFNIEKITSNSSHSPQKLGVKSETERATIKVDNHVRNMLTALANLGIYDSQKEAVEQMCLREIEELSADQRKRFEFMLDTLELKDYTRQKSKK